MAALGPWLKLSLAAAGGLALLGALAGATAMAQTQPQGGDAIGQLLQGTPQEPRPYIPKAPPVPKADADDNDDDATPASPAKPVAKAPPVPAKRPKRAGAILQALDKVTAETLRFEADVNQPVRYKDLVFTVHACEDAASDESQTGSYANLEIDSQPKPPPGQPAPPAREVFKGWMFSNAPGAHALEHPIYDAWLIACKA